MIGVNCGGIHSAACWPVQAELLNDLYASRLKAA